VGWNTFLLTDFFKYYTYGITGTATIDTVFLVESSNYDLLYAYMWLYVILKNKVVEKDDQFDIKANEILGLYNDRFKSFSPFYDADEDGEITLAEKSPLNVMRIVH
jgi:hypothetical protein